MRDEFFSCCFSGYRPQKFPFPIGGNLRYNNFENDLFDSILTLINEGCHTFYTGMAMGFDIIAAECVLTAAAAKTDRPVRLICAIPYRAQSKRYPPDWKKRYNDIYERADETILISERYYKGCYFDRNRFMVDNSDMVLTWYDGAPGGTKNTIDYALSISRKVINLYNGV